jgi:transcriptional regulator with XRE-family HTH domain
MPDSRDKTLLQFFGKRLRTARRAANLSQQGLAKRLGLGQDTISHYEQAKSMPGIVIVFELAQALCVDVRYFFPDDGLSHLAEEERETLALLSSLSPAAYQFVLTFVRYCIKSQQRRYLLSNGAEPPLLKFLERDVQVLEQTTQTACQQARRGSNLVEEDVPPLYALVSFTAVLLMGIQDRALDKRTEEMVRRIAANSSQLAVLVRELIREGQA